MQIGPKLCYPRLHIETAIRRPVTLRWRRCGRGLILIVLVTSVFIGCAKKEASKPLAPEVEVTPVTQQDVPLYTECIASLDGYVNAQIQPQVSGYLMKQNYREGNVVHKGEVLFEIDPRPFEAALEHSKGQLAQVEAQLGKTRLDVARDTPLARESAIPQA